MPEFSDIKKSMSRYEALERELHLKQLQINRLLNITQAINNNVKADGLFQMYTDFLSWEMGIRKMALFFRDQEQWVCKAHIGIQPPPHDSGIGPLLHRFNRLQNLDEPKHPFLKDFDVVIPVRHKDLPLAYVFIGGFDADEDMFNKVQFITTITNVIAVAIENKRLFKRQLEQEKLKHEMELASQFQQMLLPKTLPANQYYELDSVYRPHLNVGGDYFDFLEKNSDKIVFCIGDISGKGVAAALLMANFQANFHSLLHQHEDLEAFVRALNQAVLHITEGDRFITFFVAEYHPKTRLLRYVNAGHNPPALVMNDEVLRLRQGCTILGAVEELPNVETGELTLDSEALLLLFTDGLIDIQNPKGQFLDQGYGTRFLLENYRLSARDFNRKMMDELKNFMEGKPFPDDFTVLTCRIY